jgi:hypothetical protein
VNIDQLVAVFQSWLYLPDVSPLLVVLGAVAANNLKGDPVWLGLVGPPSSGKTQLLASISRLLHVHEVSTLTRAAFLSASTSRDPHATGGLLAEVGAFGLLVIKDLTTTLSDSPEIRSGTFAILREIYDGSFVRAVGTNGGRRIAWTGKVGLLTAVTEVVDLHTAATAGMGERLVWCRMPALTSDGRLAQGRAALANAGRQSAMRDELATAVAAFMGGLELPRTGPALSPVTTEWLIGLADLGARCRSAIERDPRDRRLELVPQSEGPGRLVAVLVQLLQGLLAIGVVGDEATRLIAKVALDSMPKARRAVVELLVAVGSTTIFTTAQVGDAVGLPTEAAGRVLEDLAAHGIAERHSGYRDSQHGWNASGWLRDRWSTLGLGVHDHPGLRHEVGHLGGGEQW